MSARLSSRMPVSAWRMPSALLASPLGLFFDDAFEQAFDKGHAAGLDHLQVVGRQQPGLVGLAQGFDAVGKNSSELGARGACQCGADRCGNLRRLQPLLDRVACQAGQPEGPADQLAVARRMPGRPLVNARPETSSTFAVSVRPAPTDVALKEGASELRCVAAEGVRSPMAKRPVVTSSNLWVRRASRMRVRRPLGENPTLLMRRHSVALAAPILTLPRRLRGKN